MASFSRRLFLAAIFTSLPTLAHAVYLNQDNISVSVGPGTSPGSFNNTFANGNTITKVIDSPTADAEEIHNQVTHIWYTANDVGGGLELLFDFNESYDISTLHFWNFTAEQYDVDRVDFEFFDDAGNAVGGLSIAPDLGSSPGIRAQDIPLAAPLNVRSVRAFLTGDNGQVDFQNIGFTASRSAPNFCAVANLDAPIDGSSSVRLEYAWDASPVLPDSLNVMNVPAVADLDLDGVPDIAFVSTSERGDSVFGNLRAIRGADGQELFTVEDSALQVNAASSVAIADIDLDGLPEILSLTSNEILAFENDGTLKWRSDSIEERRWSAVSVGDLDGDGVPEIFSGREVLNNDGTLRWRGTGGDGTYFVASYSYIADVDADGQQELIAAPSIYDRDGSIEATIGAGLSAVGNFDGDSQGEIVVVNDGRVWLYNHDGSLRWGPVSLGNEGGGPPTVADLDGDGAPEIGGGGI